MKRSGRKCGFTLIELLVVIAIIAVLLAILVPALSKAKCSAQKVLCMSNMREIGTCVFLYLEENDNLPWTYVHETNADGSLEFFPGTSIFSSYSWAGMKASRPWPGEQGGDFALVPPELRPLNKCLQPDARADQPIEILQCPSDKSAVSPTVGGGSVSVQNQQGRSSWQAFGNSYSINWFFRELLPGAFSVESLFLEGKRIATGKVGGEAAEFALIWENQMDQLFVGATPTGGGTLGSGWHCSFSTHTILFRDGHVEHKYFDTRFSQDAGWRISLK